MLISTRNFLAFSIRSSLKNQTCAFSVASSNSLDARSLKAESRTKDGSRSSRKYRQEGLVPGVLYGEGDDGQKEKILVNVKLADLLKEVRAVGISIENTLYNLHIDDKVHSVLPRDFVRDGVTDIPESVNFLRYKRNRPINIPLRFINRDASPGLKRGGFINYIKKDLLCSCETDNIPSVIEVDVSSSHVGDRFYVSQIKFPEGVKCLNVQETDLVATVGGRRSLRPRRQAASNQQDEDDEE